MPARTRSIEALRRELRATEQQLTKLSAQRGKAVKALDAIDRKTAMLTGRIAPVTAKKKKRKKAVKAVVARKVGKVRKVSKVGKVRKVHKPPKGARLVDYIRKVLSGSAGMRAKDIQTAVAKAGYQSVSKDFYNIVAATLRDKKLFRRVARGVYKLTK